MPTKTLKIHDGGKDNGFNRFNAHEGHSLVVSTNSLDDLLEGVREFFGSDPWEPDYEAMQEERSRPTYREEAIMERGMEARA